MRYFNQDGFDEYGFNKDGIHKVTGTEYDERGFTRKGILKRKWIHRVTGTEFDEHGFDKYGFDEDGDHRKTRRKFDEYGFNRNGIHRVTGTKFDEHGFDRDGFDEDGFDKYGFDEGGFDRDGIHKKTGTKYDQRGFDRDGYHRDGLLAKIKSFSFEMIPFQGGNRFAKLISGGTIDFYDSDSSAYILNVKLPDDHSEQEVDKLITAIRHSHYFKPSIFPSQKSIGAYWVTDQIDTETAKILLKKILISWRLLLTD